MTATGRRALVVTTVHRPQDARIAHRELPALLAAGWEVTYAAPFTGHDQPPPDGVTAIDLPRAAGRRRLQALRAARRLVRQHGPEHDIVLLHDPELLLTLPGSRVRHVVWDVHEDPAAALRDRDWVPPWCRRPLAAVVRLAERWAERRCAELLLAERSYATRFRRSHPVVLNLPSVPVEQPPPAGADRVVYVGRLSRSRGAEELVALGRALAVRDSRVAVDLVGYADDDVRPLLERADREGVVRWHGFLPNDRALAIVQGATAGLSLLHDLPNFAGSMPTKVVEYLAHGVPVLTTPLREAVAIVEPHELGVVVGFGDVTATADAIAALAADADRRVAIGARAWRHARGLLDWADGAATFVAALERVADCRR